MLEIESADISERLVGIPPLYLNNFLQRGLYGLSASVEPGEVRAKRRRFSKEDVYGIALAWMLFESGLRTQAIRRILNELAGTKKANARKAAEMLRTSEAEFVVVTREPRKPKGKADPDPRINTAHKSELVDIIGSNPLANILIVPVKAKFEDIKTRLQVLYGEGA